MKKIKNIIIVIALIFLLTGCYSKEEKKLIKKYEDQAKINAVDYIKEKYGFDAEIISVKAARYNSSISPIPDWAPTGDVYVKLKANKKSFYVYITGEDYSISGIDSYQQEEIEDDIIKLLKDNINFKLYDYSITYPNTDIYNITNSNLIGEYYNKNNISEVLKNIENIELYYINYNKLNTLDLTNILPYIFNTNVSLINFETIDDYEKYISEKENKDSHCQLSCDDRYIIYKKDALVINKGETKYYEYNKSSFDNEIYIYSDNLEKIDIKVSSIDLEKMKNELYNHNYYDFEQVSNVYSIPQTSAYLFIYFPNQKIKISKNEELLLGYQCYRENSDYYAFYQYPIFNVEYYFFSERFSSCDSDKNINFMLLKANK